MLVGLAMVFSFHFKTVPAQAIPAAAENDMVSDTGAIRKRLTTLVVDFEKGKSALTPATKDEITTFLNQARSQQPINEVYVAAYADAVRPSDNSLSEHQQDLARRRAANIRNYIEQTHKYDVSTFNMAKRADFISRLFAREDAKVKQDSQAPKDTLALEIEQKGKPKTALLIVEPANLTTNLSE